jgi:hypothetical protein
MTFGFDQLLHILPFDHRGSFQTKMFGWDGTLTPGQTAQGCFTASAAVKSGQSAGDSAR